MTSSTFSFSNPIPLSQQLNFPRPNPTFTDIDNDGDLDLFTGSSYGNGSISYIENTGTSYAPIFETSVYNPFGIGYVSRTTFPTFADINNDGLKDLVIGTDYGIVYYANTGTNTNPWFAKSYEINPFNFYADGAIIPTFVDIDADEDLDLFIGERQSGLTFYENISSNTSSPIFGSPVNNPFGLSTSNVNIYQAAPAFADVDNDGDLDLFVGDKQSNRIYVYSNFGNPETPYFVLQQDNSFEYISYGMRAIPTFSDIDDDGDSDLLIGSDYNVLFYENSCFCLAIHGNGWF
jgi:hypothetical protein